MKALGLDSLSKKPSLISSKLLSWDEKKAYCHRWKLSGLSKSEFARREKLVIGSLCEWCNKLWPKDKKKTKNKADNNWAQVTMPSDGLDVSHDFNFNHPPIQCTVRLISGLELNISAHSSEMATLIKALGDGA